jgi:hypothetical protein
MIRLLRHLSALALALASGACLRTGPDPFFASGPDRGAGLPDGGIYPRGRTMAFMGYSGDPARDLTNGFTVAGPVYGDQRPYLERCFSNGWPVVAHTGLRVTFNDRSSEKYKVDEAFVRAEVGEQVRALAEHREIVWWAVTPEETRPWRGDEMTYLAAVSAAIRESDARARPIFLYNPNNRDAGSLAAIVPHVDIVGKGCYVNLSGHKRDRAWVRWSVEQEAGAIRAAGRTNAVPILVPELCRDPEPAEDTEIRAWVRHDVYLGLCSGAKGVLIWSLFRRGEVRRTWQTWYDAYAGCARELGGTNGLAQVFLFGEPRSDLGVEQVAGAGEAAVRLGGAVEPGTTSPEESAERRASVRVWTTAEFAHGGRHWLFLVNSANEPAAFRVSGWPRGARIEDAFGGGAADLRGGVVALPAYGVAGFRFAPRGGP